MTQLNSRTCAAHTADGSTEWCMKFGAELFGGVSYSWSCGNPVFCEAFVPNGTCVWVELSTPYVSCDGVVWNEPFKQYEYCCVGDNCNYGDFNISECTQSIEYQNYWDNFWQCQVDETTEAWGLICDDSKDEITCNELEIIFKQDMSCFCTEYSGFYDRVSNATKSLVQQELNTELSVYSQWNDLFGCNIYLECDLLTGEIINVPPPNTTSTSLISTLSTVIVNDIGKDGDDKSSGPGAIGISLIVISLIIVFGCVLIVILYNRKFKKIVDYDAAIPSDKDSRAERVRSISDIDNMEKDQQTQDGLKNNTQDDYN